MIREGLGESGSREPSQVIKLPWGTQGRWAAGKTWRTSTVLCKYMYGPELSPGPLGPISWAVWQELSSSERLTGPVGKAKQTLISFLGWHIYLMSRRNRPGEALRLGTAGGPRAGNSCSSCSVESCKLGPGPVGPSFPFTGQTGNSLGNLCLRLIGEVLQGCAWVRLMGVRWWCQQECCQLCWFSPSLFGLDGGVLELFMGAALLPRTSHKSHKGRTWPLAVGVRGLKQARILKYFRFSQCVWNVQKHPSSSALEKRTSEPGAADRPEHEGLWVFFRPPPGPRWCFVPITCPVPGLAPFLMGEPVIPTSLASLFQGGLQACW